jgi:hypothetical protein
MFYPLSPFSKQLINLALRYFFLEVTRGRHFQFLRFAGFITCCPFNLERYNLALTLEAFFYKLSTNF